MTRPRSRHRFDYDVRNRRTVHVDRRGHPLYFELNELGKVVKRVDPIGNETVSTYDSRGNKTSETDERGNVTAMTYDAGGNLRTRIDPLGARTTFDYGAFARLLSTTDALNSSTVNSYDAAGNLLTTTDALGNVTHYDYTVDGLPETITRPGGAVTSMVYDAVGNVLTMEDPEGGVTRMDYDAAGHLIETTDPGGERRSMVVDARGQMRQMTDAAQAVTSFAYDPDGNRSSVTDPDNEITQFAYDALGRLVATTDANGNTSTQEYDAEGNVVARTDVRGFRSTMSYDAIGRLIESCDALDNCTAMTYCAELGTTPKAVLDALGNVTLGQCDALGREVSRTDPLGNTVTTDYDLLGRRTLVTDPTGQETRFDYDELGRVTKVTDALLGESRYGYDERGNRTSVTDASDHTTSFEYDLANRLVRETTPIGTVTEYGYDASGRRTQKLDGKGQVTEYIYDESGRMTETLYDDGGTASFGYDPQGRRIFEENQDSTREQSYDALGRLERVIDVATGRTLEYGYDPAGNRTSMTVLPEGEVTSYAWDARGLLTRMTDPEAGEYRFDYDALGRRTIASYPNGMTLFTVYDEASRVLGMVYVNEANELIEFFGYGYDARGNRTAKIFGDGSAEVYGYDALSRLTSVRYPSGRSVQYSYDPVGNRVLMREGTSGTGPTPCPGDSDCDGHVDAADNCPSIANPTQQDSDSGMLNAQGATAVYRFEESSGDALSSVGTMNASLVGGATRTAGGHSGQALSLDGSSGYMELPSQPVSSLFGPAFTFSLFAQSSPVLDRPTWGFLASGDNTSNPFASYDAGLNFGNGTCPGCYRLMTPIANAALAPSYTHYAVSSDGSLYRLYVDGELVNAAPVQVVPESAGDRSFVVGQSGFVSVIAQHFRGKLDDVALYSRALTTPEIELLAETGPFGDGVGDGCDGCPASADPSCVPSTCQDADADGYGVQGASACPGGTTSFDCNDASSAVHPGVLEACDSIDNDCDGQVDELCMGNVVTTTYVYNAFNQLLSSTGPGGSTTFAYDLNGNQTTKVEPTGTTTYTWDARDRLVTVVAPGGTSHFGYDTQNLRVRTQAASGTRRILLDGMEELAEYTVGSGTRAARYDHDPSRIDALLGQQTGTTKVHAAADALGSVYAFTDAASSAVSRYGYDAWGARAAAAEAVATKFGFTGRVHDTGAGDAMYFRARYLDTEAGRFVQADPAGTVDGPNLYRYAIDSPTNLTDPTGLFVRVFCEPVLSSGPAGSGFNARDILRVGAVGIGMAAGLAPLHCFIRVGCADFRNSQCFQYDRRLELLGAERSGGPGQPVDIQWPGEVAPGTVTAQSFERAPSLGCWREDCVLNNFKRLTENLPPYNGLGPNSNTFAAALVRGCGVHVFWPDAALGSNQEWPM